MWQEQEHMDQGAHAGEDHTQGASPDAHTWAEEEADGGDLDSGPFHEPVVDKANMEEGRLG